MILNGRQIAQKILENLEIEIAEFFEENPKKPLPVMAVVLVGNNPASLAYIKMKKKRCEEVGMNFLLKKFDKNISQNELETEVQKLANNPQVTGLIVQSPLPNHLDMEKILEFIPENKDIDGFTRSQIGNIFLGKNKLASCTPAGIMALLQENNIKIAGKNVAILGRSNIVGKPMALMMINAGATVTICNSKTKNLSNFTKNADIIIVAIGKPKFLSKDMVSKKAIIIDVGSNLLEDGTFCGDADFDNLVDFVAAISPSPGGVGPMTVATLVANTWKAFQMQNPQFFENN